MTWEELQTDGDHRLPLRPRNNALPFFTRLPHTMATTERCPPKNRSKLRGIRLIANELPYFFIAATTEISTRSSGRAIRASTQARAGACPADTHASHTSFMAAKSFISRT